MPTNNEEQIYCKELINIEKIKNENDDKVLLVGDMNGDIRRVGEEKKISLIGV